jgi:hypothetical protein
MRSLPGSPVDRVLTACLIIAPVVYLIADVLYAIRGWDDPTAAVFHILGAIGYTLVLLRLVTWGDGALAAILLVVGVLGAAGNVAYGFNTIHVSLGDTGRHRLAGRTHRQHRLARDPGERRPGRDVRSNGDAVPGPGHGGSGRITGRRIHCFGSVGTQNRSLSPR